MKNQKVGQDRTLSFNGYKEAINKCVYRGKSLKVWDLGDKLRNGW